MVTCPRNGHQATLSPYLSPARSPRPPARTWAWLDGPLCGPCRPALSIAPDHLTVENANGARLSHIWRHPRLAPDQSGAGGRAGPARWSQHPWRSV